MQLVCPHCGTLNKIPEAKSAQNAGCGKCHSNLFTGKPLEVNQAQFDRQLQKSTLPLVVDFWAPWCGPCKSMAPVFERMAAKIEPSARLLKVNTETEQALSARYSIRSIPTLMIFSAAQEVVRMSGALDASSMQAWINKHI
jgi:thioredoxin 2